jgi:drug/metabolite transporter (DMT)-like permease
VSQNFKAYFMLVCATLFWAGNFNIGKFAFIESISPFTLAFLRWLLVWIILMPLTYKEILSLKKKYLKILNYFFY